MSQLQTIRLTVDEFEAIRLNDFEGLDQTVGSEKMRVSQPTFHRILGSGRKKVADALTNGKAIRIEGGDYRAASTEVPRCKVCNHEWEESRGTEKSNRSSDTQLPAIVEKHELDKKA